jgi:hypothetical protein
MSLATRAPSSVSRGAAIALAAAGPVAIGGILAARLHDPRPMIAAPAIVFGVVAATAPALYIATAAAGHAPPLAAMVRAFGVALGAFGIALAGVILPAAFAALSSVSPGTAIAASTAAIAAAGLLGLRRLASELAAGRPGPVQPSLAGGAVFLIWAASALAIAGRLWWDLAVEVAS